MALVPVISDEAYYFYWAMHPSGGYYDLPPMIGWWLIPFTKISLAPFWLRLPNLLSWLMISVSIYEWLSRGILKARAQWIAISFALLPLPYFSLLMFPDIPLLFYCYFSAYLFFRAVNLPGKHLFSFFLSGALLGAAFLSKYFAAFMLPAFFLWFFSRRKGKELGLVWFCLGGVPFVLQHFIWNQSHCWANVIFNLVTRQNVNDGPLYQILGLFIFYLALASAPFWKTPWTQRLKFNLEAGLENANWVSSLSSFMGCLWMVPVLTFTFTAILGRGQGLHWLLFVLPFFIIWIGLRLDETKLASSVKTLIAITGGISIIALTVSVAPEKSLGPIFQHRFQFDFARLIHQEEWIEAIRTDVLASNIVFTEGYTFSSGLNYDLEAFARSHEIEVPEVSVWGSGSRFGRVFDWTIDFKKYDGKKVLIITPGPFGIEGWKEYFTSLKTEARQFRGNTFYVSTGEGFKSAHYLEKEFSRPIKTYYTKGCSLWEVTHP